MSEADTTQPDWIAQPLTTEEIQQCKDAGASHAFIRVLETEPPAGVSRHSVRLEIKKQLREWDNDPEEMTRLAGDFFTGLWKGNKRVYEGHADSNNTQILAAAGVL
jgi:hypothetical protein